MAGRHRFNPGGLLVDGRTLGTPEARRYLSIAGPGGPEGASKRAGTTAKSQRLEQTAAFPRAGWGARAPIKRAGNHREEPKARADGRVPAPLPAQT
jgi:hypothetical protein